MSGPVELTSAQRVFDFEASNPGRTGVSFPYPVPPSNPPTNEDCDMAAAVTIYEADTVVRFGKYKGKDYKIKNIMSLDPKYLLWAHHNIEWFALTEPLYYDACVLADVAPDEKQAEKAAQSLEQHSEYRDNSNGFDEDDVDEPPHINGYDPKKDDVPF